MGKIYYIFLMKLLIATAVVGLAFSQNLIG